jgi:hypothetical protein
MSKNIHDLSDDEFDDLFRESAEKSGIGFDPEAWNKMNQKLDVASALPSSSGKGGNPLTKWGLPTVVVLLLLITGTYFLIRKPSEAITETKVKAKENPLKQTDKVAEKHVATDKVGTENQENAKETSVSSDKVQADKASSIQPRARKANESLSATNVSDKAGKELSPKIKQNQKDNKGDLATKTLSDTQEKVPQVENEQKAKDVSLSKKAVGKNKVNAYSTPEKSSDTVIPTTQANTVIAKDKTERKSQLATVSEEKSGKTKELTENNNQTSVSKIDNVGSINAVDGELKTTTQNQSLIVDSANTIEKMQWVPVRALSPAKHSFAIDIKLPNIRFESPLLAPVSIPRANTAFRKGLNIRLALSPDFSFIPSNTVFKVGNNWAVILEYRFNNRLSIQTGVIRSLKLYNALPSQYEWNAYWTMPSPLKDIDATCKMLDIPLNIRYDISQKPNSRWFVGAGFTSYIMLKEEYRYNYENPYDPNIKRTNWEGKTGGYPFSVLNLSAGYERQLFKRLTFQAEPFYKAPLGKVGYGKVRLATAGVFFSVKYPF